MIELPVFVPPSCKSVVTPVTVVTPTHKPTNTGELEEKPVTKSKKHFGHIGHAHNVNGHSGHTAVSGEKTEALETKGLEVGVTSVTTVTSEKTHTCSRLALGLNGSCFTLAMIEEGLKRWKQPFCENDLTDIEAGKWSKEGIDRYLSWWASRYKEHYRELRFKEYPRTSRKECFYN